MGNFGKVGLVVVLSIIGTILIKFIWITIAVIAVTLVIRIINKKKNEHNTEMWKPWGDR